MFLTSLFALTLIGAAAATEAQQPPITVQTTSGPVVGRRTADVLAFKAVPYAAPPVEDLRWRPPQPPQPWTEPRDASAVGPICVQRPANGDNGVGPLPMSEDCLTLNVWTPAQAREPAAVMVWIHGGGLNNGSGTADLYDGANLARRGVMVVTINYRLGRLGFFDHPALAAERGPGEPAGNYGLMDVIQALRWVRENASAFGGDPDRVTIFGESAGGALVTRLMVSPQALGLFHRAVVQSGLGREEGTPLERPGPDGGPSLQDRGEVFAAELGLVRPSSAELRSLPAERLLSPEPSFFGGDLLVRDSVYVGEDVEPAFAQGRSAPVPMIIGTNSAEFWWMKPSDPSPYGALDDDMTGQERADLIAAYGGQEGYDAHVVSDLVFNEPARRLARLHARHGRPVYLYRFDVVSEAMPEPHEGATHASERQYVFDNLNASPWPTTAMDEAQADHLAGYWTTFARTGNPNGGLRQAWPEMGEQPDQLLEFTNEGPFARAIPHADRLDLIERYWRRLR